MHRLLVRPVQLSRSNARVVELVDTPDSKSGARKSVTVQVRPLVPFSSV